MIKFLVISFLLIPSIARAQSTEPILHIEIGSLIILQETDLGVTQFLLGRNLGHESNPFFALLSDKPLAFSIVKASSAVAISYFLIKYHKNHPKMAMALAGFGNAVYLYAVIHNARIIK